MIVGTTGLTKRYGAHTALDGVDLAVPPGSVHDVLVWGGGSDTGFGGPP